MVYLEDVPNKGSALRRELAIKKLPRSKKLTLIQEQTVGQKLLIGTLLPDVL